MKGYKHTELGWIPEEWELKELGDISEITRLAGEEYTSLWEENPKGEIIALRGYNIGINKIIERNTARISNELSLKLKRSRLYKGDIAYPCVGTIENAVVIEEDNKYHIQQNIAKITPAKEMNSYYVSHYLMSDLAKNEIRRFNATTSQPNVLVGSLRKYRIPIPSFNEQRCIAQVLTFWDKSIEILTQLIVAKQQLKNGLMQQLLTGKKRLPGFKKEWNLVRLGEVSEIDKFSLNAQTPEDYKFQYLSLADVDTGTAIIKSEKISFKDAPSRARRIVKKGDVLVSTVRPNLQGFLIIKDDAKDLIASTGFAVLSCNKIHNEFLYQYLFTKDLMNQIEALVVGSNYPAISSSDISNLIIPCPDIKEQIAIASILSEANAELTLINSVLSHVKLQKKGLMQQLLTGKKRVKV